MAAVRDWLVFVLSIAVIFLTIPVGNEIRDWLLFSRPPAEAERVTLSRDVADLSLFPLLSHGREGFSVVERKDDRWVEGRHIALPHDAAVLARDRLLVLHDGVVRVYRFRKDKPPALVRALPAEKPLRRVVAWHDQYAIVESADFSLSVVDVTTVETRPFVANFSPPVPVRGFGYALWKAPLFTDHGVLFWHPDTRPGADTNFVQTVSFPTESPPTMVRLVRGRLMVGQENGELEEIQTSGDTYRVTRSVRLPAAPIAATGTKWIVFVACRDGTLCVLDWRDESRLVRKHETVTGTPFRQFVMYGEQGFALVDDRTIVRYTPTPGGRLAIGAVAAAPALIGVSFVYWLWFVRRQRSWPRLVVMAMVALGYAYYLRQIDIPIEAAHFLEYGLLAVFGARAVRHHLADWGVYLAALLLCLFTGLLDEAYQHLHPARTGDLDDVWLNGKSGALMLVALVAGAPFAELGRWCNARSQRWVAALVVINAVGIGLFIQHVCQFGHRIEVEGVGTFVSRLSPERLREIDSHDAVARATRLESFADKPYDQSLRALGNDTFLYELRVHLFRRDANFNRAGYFVAYKEHRLIEAYFSNTVARTSFRWTDSQLQKSLAEIGDEAGNPYHSAVAAEVITRYRPGTMWTGIGAITVASVWLMVRPVRRSAGVSTPTRTGDTRTRTDPPAL